MSFILPAKDWQIFGLFPGIVTKPTGAIKPGLSPTPASVLNIPRLYLSSASLWNHGQGHDSAVGLRISSLLEDNDRSGGEEPARIQPKTALLWEGGAQVKGSHGDQPQGSGRFISHYVNTHIWNLHLFSWNWEKGVFTWHSQSVYGLHCLLKLPAFKCGDVPLNESCAACFHLEVRTQMMTWIWMLCLHRVSSLENYLWLYVKQCIA